MRRYGLAVVCEPAEKAGVSVYATELARAIAPLLAPDERLVVIRHRGFSRPVRHARVEDVALALPAGRSGVRRLLEQLVLPAAALFLRLDLLHGVNHVLPLLYPGRAVVSVHDTRLFLGRGGADLGRRIFRRIVYPASLWRADEALADSAAGAAEIAAAFGVPLARLRVVPLGVDARYAAAGPAPAERPYVLHVGQQEPHKNLPRLAGAFAAALRGGLAREGRRPALVLAGSRGADSVALGARIAAEKVEADVIRRGYVPPEDLPGLYAGAAALAYPSILEGFGFPPLEAMAAGVPVLAGDIPALRESLGDAALFVDPADEGAIAAGLARIVGDEALRAALVERGRARAALFSWRRTAERTLEVYRGLVAGRR
jgi:alpha-1,3-rhamnosyl/mannosyltransferase